MTLINCHECKQSISDKADRCPHCGIYRALEEPLIKNALSIQTVQETSKYLKAWLAVGYCMISYGLYALFTIESIQSIADGTESNPSWIFLVGLLIIIFTKLSIWWNHK